MIVHYILMSSSYTLGTRIALDKLIIECKDQNQEEIKNIVNRIMEECGNDVSISTHFIPTESENWESVVNKDPFFKNVKVIENIDEFIRLIKQDRIISGIDVAKYILSKITCTHLKLQKLVYLCYAEYLYDKQDELFNDSIYAFKYGPVVESVYLRYKGKYGDLVSTENKEDINLDKNLELPFRSKIIFSENGTRKIFSIDRTLEKYGKFSASELVDITHKKNTPWAMTYDKKVMYKKIENETILKYHGNETV